MPIANVVGAGAHIDPQTKTNIKSNTKIFEL